jgi:hypothetical protein
MLIFLLSTSSKVFFKYRGVQQQKQAAHTRYSKTTIKNCTNKGMFKLLSNQFYIYILCFKYSKTYTSSKKPDFWQQNCVL